MSIVEGGYGRAIASRHPSDERSVARWVLLLGGRRHGAHDNGKPSRRQRRCTERTSAFGPVERSGRARPLVA